MTSIVAIGLGSDPGLGIAARILHGTICSHRCDAAIPRRRSE
jgi:hypothetical protein